MHTAIRLVAAVLIVAPVFAADHPDFKLWKADELKRRDAALSKKVGADHSARETLADFGDHRVRFLYRNADGFPEQHDNIVDLVFVQSGEGVLQLGGTVIDKKATGSPGEFVGSRLERIASPARRRRRHPHPRDGAARVPRAEGQTRDLRAGEVSRAVRRTTMTPR